MKPRVQNRSKLQDFLKMSSETQTSMVFSKNRNTWIKNEFTNGWLFLRVFDQNTVFHVFDQNLIIKCQDRSPQAVRRWSNFPKCHFLDFPDFTWIHIFYKKWKISTFLAKCKNARKMSKFLQKIPQKHFKKLRFWWKTRSEDHSTVGCRPCAAGQTSETGIFRIFMFFWKITELP